MYVDYHRGEIFAGIAGRIGLALGMDTRLETDELIAVWKGIERRHRLLLPVPEPRSEKSSTATIPKQSGK